MAILLNVYGTPQRHEGVILTDKAGVRVARDIDNRLGRAVIECKVQDCLQYIPRYQVAKNGHSSVRGYSRH